MFARFPEYIHNIERLANGGGGSYYVLDPLQDNRRVPAAWTIGAQRRSNVTRAERGLPAKGGPWVPPGASRASPARRGCGGR